MLSPEAHRQQVRRIRAAFARWRRALKPTFKCTVHVQRCAKDEDPESDFLTNAECEAKWEYKEAVFYFFTEPLAEQNDAYLDRTIAHEFAHAYVNELSRSGDEYYRHEERVASELADAFVRLYTARHRPTRRKRC